MVKWNQTILGVLKFLDKVQCITDELTASAQSAMEICCQAMGGFARAEAAAKSVSILSCTVDKGQVGNRKLMPA